MEYALLAGIGLAAASGLNAYAPLLILGGIARLSDRVVLTPPFDALASPLILIILLLFLTIEIVADKVPLLEQRNRPLQRLASPISGGIVLGACAATGGLEPVGLYAALGVVVAFVVRLAKNRFRASAVLGAHGMFNPLLSMAEDGLAIMTSILAVILPIASVPFLLGIAAYGVAGLRKVPPDRTPSGVRG